MERGREFFSGDKGRTRINLYIDLCKVCGKAKNHPSQIRCPFCGGEYEKIKLYGSFEEVSRFLSIFPRFVRAIPSVGWRFLRGFVPGVAVGTAVGVVGSSISPRAGQGAQAVVPGQVQVVSSVPTSLIRQEVSPTWGDVIKKVIPWFLMGGGLAFIAIYFIRKKIEKERDRKLVRKIIKSPEKEYIIEEEEVE